MNQIWRGCRLGLSEGNCHRCGLSQTFDMWLCMRLCTCLVELRIAVALHLVIPQVHTTVSRRPVLPLGGLITNPWLQMSACLTLSFWSSPELIVAFKATYQWHNSIPAPWKSDDNLTSNSESPVI
jgi:hypothetical protein